MEYSCIDVITWTEQAPRQECADKDKVCLSWAQPPCKTSKTSLGSGEGQNLCMVYGSTSCQTDDLGKLMAKENFRAKY